MKVGVPRETWPGEHRVALIPSAAAALKKSGLEVVVEQDAGLAAGFPSSAYEQAGATVAARDAVFATADIILQVRSVPPDAGRLRKGQVVIGFADPLGEPDAIRVLAQAGVTAFSMELMPRITRAQSMDALSSMATIAGYKDSLTPIKRTKTGPSTDADSLQKMAAAKAHPILDDLMRYREVEKLRSTYADALPPLIGPDGRIHATFNQIATTTGRISSENPNLQNIPVRTAGGREMRRAFVADEGNGLLTADYSQIELRILAHLAEDPGLVDAFQSGDDVHTITAAKVFDVDEKKVDEFQRRFAKVVNYGLAYGMEAYGLGQRLDIPTDQAREILDSYFESFPNVHEFMERTVTEASTRGYTTTILGRRRQISELASDNFRIRQMGERMAQNAPVQGSAADIFKLAMVDVDRALDERRLRTPMLLTVHDELVFEVPLDERDAIERLVREVMESVIELRVPLVVDLGFGTNWALAK